MARPTKLSFQQPEVMDYADFGAGATCPVQRATFNGFNFLANVAGIIRASDLNMAGSAESHAEVVYDLDINATTT